MAGGYVIRLDEPDRRGLSAALRTGRTAVTLVVPPVGGKPVLLPTALAEGVTVEVRWEDVHGQRRPGLVRLAHFAVTDDALFPALHVDGGDLRVEITGRLSCQAASVRDATLRLQSGSLHAGRLSVNETGVVEGVSLGHVLVRSCRGTFVARTHDRGAMIETAARASIARTIDDPQVTITGVVWDSEFDDVLVNLRSGSRLERCRGKIRLVSCRGATIHGARQPPLTVEAAFEVQTAIEQRSFKDAELKDVAIEPHSVEDVARIADQFRVLDPAPGRLREALAAIDEDRRLRVAELLHDRMSEKAARQHTVDVAAVEVLALRRRATQRFRAEWWLLTSYSVFGYGRMIRRPLLIWLVIVGLVLGTRFYRAVDDGAGFVTDRDGPRVTFSAAAITTGMDIGLTTVLLPVTWSKSARTAEVRLRAPGGYLTALRVAMILPLLAVGSAVRRRVRIKPRNETS